MCIYMSITCTHTHMHIYVKRYDLLKGNLSQICTQYLTETYTHSLIMLKFLDHVISHVFHILMM